VGSQIISILASGKHMIKKAPLVIKGILVIFLLIVCVSIAIAFTGFLQVDTTVSDGWLSLVRLLGGGAIGIIMLIAITRLVQALRNQPLDGHRVTSELSMVVQKLDMAITVMNTTTRSDHERMLKHDEDFLKRMEVLTLIENQALSNHSVIMGNQNNIIKQLDRMEQKTLNV
jgi:hypothetical protein